MELTINAELHNLYNWLISNKLSLNILKKVKLCNFSSIPKKLNYDPRLMFLTMKAIKRLPLNAKTLLNIFDC